MMNSNNIFKVISKSISAPLKGSLSLFIVLGVLFISSCSDENLMEDPILKPIDPMGYIDQSLMVDVGGYSLFAETKGKGSTTIVYESGLGDDREVWKQGVYDGVSVDVQQIIYNRGGYAPSEVGTNSIGRHINQLAKELKVVVDSMSQNEKVILVGHSLGGPIIRSFVNQFPDKVEAMLFVDPAHEGEYDAASIQVFEDHAIAIEVPNIPQLQHVRNELEQLSENWEIQLGLPSLPRIPVAVLTAMSLNDDGSVHTQEERDLWFDLHSSLGEGVLDFVHRGSSEVGHSIHVDKPSMVVEALVELMNK